MYTDFNHFYCYNKKCMSHKSKSTTSPLFCNPYLAKHTTANIDATFSNLKHSKIYSKQFSSTYSVLAYLFTAMLYDDTQGPWMTLLKTYCVYGNAI